MLPQDWTEVGKLTPYELKASIETYKYLWKMKKAALACFDCGHQPTKYNIEMLERL